ncbi:NAD(P)-binding domain-containing protein [Paraburkholderia fungorum]|uniref:NAD(P)-binding domain-containing protein n=1 Tax=Paraburkholderia fungorum TaxID=134537 RepID=UPI0038B6CE2F
MDRWIGFIGINAMRQGVARNLIKVGFEVCGCDVRAVSVAAFVEHGGKGCDAPAQFSAQYDVAIKLVDLGDSGGVTSNGLFAGHWNCQAKSQHDLHGCVLYIPGKLDPGRYRQLKV